MTATASPTTARSSLRVTNAKAAIWCEQQNHESCPLRRTARGRTFYLFGRTAIFFDYHSYHIFIFFFYVFPCYIDIVIPVIFR